MIGDARAVPALLEALKEPNTESREAVIKALGQIGDPRAAPALLAAMKNPSLQVRQAAVEALGEVGGPQALAALRAALEDADPGLRESAVQALGHLGDPGAADDLVAALGDSSGSVRFWAAISLGAVGNAKSGDALLPLLDDKDVGLQAVAAMSLGLLGRSEALPRLSERLEGNEHWQAFAAVVGLASIKTPEARQMLRGGAGGAQSSRLRRFAAGAAANGLVPAMVEELGREERSSGPDTAYFAANALLYVADPASLPALRQAAKSHRTDIRLLAREAIRHIERLSPAAAPGGNP